MKRRNLVVKWEHLNEWPFLRRLTTSISEDCKIIATHEDKNYEKIINDVIEYYIKEHKEEYDAIIQSIGERFTNFLRYGNIDFQKGEKFNIK